MEFSRCKRVKSYFLASLSTTRVARRLTVKSRKNWTMPGLMFTNLWRQVLCDSKKYLQAKLSVPERPIIRKVKIIISIKDTGEKMPAPLSPMCTCEENIKLPWTLTIFPQETIFHSFLFFKARPWAVSSGFEFINIMTNLRLCVAIHLCRQETWRRLAALFGVN